MPVDFEVVHVNSAVETEDDINNAITAIRRNGVALKGKQTPFFSCVTSGAWKHEKQDTAVQSMLFIVRP